MQLRSSLASLTLMAVAAAPAVLGTPQAQAAPVAAIAATKAPAAKVAVYKATGPVYVRTGASTKTRPLGVLKKGQAVQTAGSARGKWQPVNYKGRTGYVSLRYLSAAGKSTITKMVTVKTKTARRASVTSSVRASQVSMPRGVNGNAQRVAHAARSNFPQISSMGGYRAEYGSDHGTGRAVDVMIPNYRSNMALGQQIANYMRANAKSLGITYVIYNQKIWSVQRSGEGWRQMGNRGSDNANHKNHVHVSVR